VLVIAGIPLTAQLPSEVGATGETLRLSVSEVTPERVTLQLEQAVPVTTAADPRRATARVQVEDPPRTVRVGDEERSSVALSFTSDALGRLDLRLEVGGGHVQAASRRPRAARSSSPTRPPTGSTTASTRARDSRPGSASARGGSRSTSMREADVSAALRYTGTGAPQVVAAGRGHVAAAILEQARSAGVPVHEDPELADALAGLALGSEVPEELWGAVAAALAWVYSVSDSASTSNR
jgi:flagellar biosynthesis protein